MEIKNRMSDFYVCTLDPKSAVDMGDILMALKKTIKNHNKNVTYGMKNPWRETKDMYKRITVKGRKPLDGKRSYHNDIANKYTNAQELDIYIHNDTTRTYNTRSKLGLSIYPL